MNMVNIKAKHNKTTLIIMRHGEVENLGKVLYGRLPGFGLSQKGILQVISSAEKLQGRKVWGDLLFRQGVAVERDAGRVQIRAGQNPGVGNRRKAATVWRHGHVTRCRAVVHLLHVHVRKPSEQRVLVGKLIIQPPL